MKRRFNITGSCNPKRHYMVQLDSRLKKIKKDFVDCGSYFAINRGRQYGKTTTLKALEEYLNEEYIVLPLDFQQIGTEDFIDEATFAKSFAQVVLHAFVIMGSHGEEEFLQPLTDFTKKTEERNLKELFFSLSEMCAKASKPVVLMIDEVDSASNNQVFIDFLAQLRMYYLNRDKTPTFHSVILAGVYDIKNLKLKLRPESDHRYNSPWNIAADFDIDMSLSAPQIAKMLEDYETDNRTGMTIKEVAEEIYQYTSGYPVLVSSICRQLDEKVIGTEGFETMQKTWADEGIKKAVGSILKKVRRCLKAWQSSLTHTLIYTK